MAHTPTSPLPWHHAPFEAVISDHVGSAVAFVDVFKSREECQANARLIVTAVNAFESMKLAIELAQTEIGASGNWMAKDFGWKRACEAIETALKLAKDGTE